MAMDLIRSWDRSCRSWLELTLLTLEANNVLDAMLESSPPHFHVALFPSEYRRIGVEILEKGEQTHYEVARGDTLWKIAKRHQTDVFSVKQINGLRSSRIYIGQVLRLPMTR
jgi:nucleoid-associated protein YgaU